jgi:hypothetical protein
MSEVQNQGGRFKGSYLDVMAGDLLRSRATKDMLPDSAPELPANDQWVAQAFLIALDRSGASSLSKEDRNFTKISSATIKYTDSSLGGNIAINPPPQFTPYCDPPSGGLFGSNDPFVPTSKDDTPFNTLLPNPANQNYGSLSYGQGHYYSEAIDDNSQIIHMRFGVTAYNSLTQFLTGFYNSGMATAARAGRFTDSGWQKLFTTVGEVIGLALAPLFIVPMVILATNRFFQQMLDIPATKFAYFKATMPMYWTAVSSIVNQMTTNMGLTGYFNTRQAKEILGKGNGLDEDGAPLQTVVSQYIQDGFMSETGVIDVRMIASRAKRMQQQFNIALDELFNKASDTASYEDLILQAYRNTREAGRKFDDGMLNPEDYLKKWADVWLGSDEKEIDQDIRNKPTIERNDDGTVKSVSPGSPKSFAQRLSDYYIAEAADGSDWVSFRVDYTGTVQESFSNNTSPSSLASTMNSISSKAREIRYSTADLNLFPGMETIKEALTSVMGGAASVLQLDGLAMLAGNAFVDIPDNWESSVASLPKSDYSITLISPYGNAVSQLMSIYIPLACLLAGALPLATGAQSHTHPFFCQLHDRGRSFIRYGVIDRLSISRGTSNLGFNNEGKAMAMEVSFSVKDLSSIVAIPITQQGFSLLNPLEGFLDDQTAFQDYMQSVCGMTLPDMIYPWSRLKYRANKKLTDIDTYFSAANLASKLTSFPGTGILNAIFQGTNRQ